MLQFLRKHQRIFFIFVTVAIVLSFTFFGTYSSLAGTGEVPDQVVVKGVDGSDLMQRDLNALCRFIGTSVLDRSGWQQGKMPNLLNDSVIEKDLIGNGMGMILARRYFEELKAEIEQRMPQIRRFRPYAHPHAPYLNAEVVWQRFNPALSQHLSLLREKSDQLTMETLAILFQLYLDQATLPPDMLKQILVYHQNQQGIPPDPVLQHADLSLFGFQSLEDWFGPRFVELSGQFIMNAALLADERGYRVSNEAIRADLFQNIYTGYKQISQEGAISVEDAEKYYQAELRNLGLDEASALNAWRQVMLFRSLFHDVGNAVFLDRLPFEQFGAFAKDSVQVDLYELPSAFQLPDIRSLLRLQVYLEAISNENMRNKTELPTSFLSLEQIEKRAPELVEQYFELEYAEVDREDLMRAISLKQTWDWEVEDAHWELIKKQFSSLAHLKAETLGERHSLLDKLEAKERLKVDQFAREKMIVERPEEIASALSLASTKYWSMGLRAKGGSFPLIGVKDQAALLDLLRQTPLLNCYSPDGRHFYRIAVIKQHPEKTVLTFADALRDGTLDRMLDERLEVGYPDVRRRNPSLFQTKDGSWKSLIEVKDAVGRLVYADLLKTIENFYRKEMGELPGKSGELPGAFYAKHRLLSYVMAAKKDLIAQVEPQLSNPLAGQWQLVRTARTIQKSTSLPFPKERMFSLAISEWSPVEIGDLGALAFYQVLGKDQTSVLSVAELEQGQKAISLDAQRSFMIDFLNLIGEKKAIK
jgi:GcvH upstream region-like protein